MTNKITPPGQIVKGHKATDKNMQCRGYQFEIGKWHIYDGDIALCESGFHFCEYPSGPWAFYSDEGTRIFEVQARRVIKSVEPGAALKHVCMEIMLVKEVSITGDRNTGNWNTGNWNTGDRNTGDRNTGNWNTGDRNTGSGNTGSGNTGSGNTGNGNSVDRCSGHLCTVPPPMIIFDELVKDGIDVDMYKVEKLSKLMMSDEPIDPEQFLSLPNATTEKILALHQSHIERRKTRK